MISDEELKEIETLSKQVPSGPWSFDFDEEEIHAYDWEESSGDPAHICQIIGPKSTRQVKGEYIAKIHGLIPRLLENQKDMREAMKRLAQMVDEKEGEMRAFKSKIVFFVTSTDEVTKGAMKHKGISGQDKFTILLSEFNSLVMNLNSLIRRS